MNRIFVIFAFLVVLISPALAAPAISITGSNLTRELTGGADNSLYVDFKSSATIPVPVIFHMKLNRTTNITTEFTLKDVKLNGEKLYVIPYVNGSKQHWYLVKIPEVTTFSNSTEDSSAINIKPLSSNRITMNLFLHPATEPEAVTLDLAILPEDVLIDVNEITKTVPGDVKYIYISKPVNQTVTVEKEVVVEKTPANLQEIIATLEGRVKEMNDQLTTTSIESKDKEAQAEQLSKQNSTLTVLLAVTSVGLLGSVGYIGYNMYMRDRRIKKSLSDL